MSAQRLEVNGCDEAGDVRLFEPFNRQLSFLGLVVQEDVALLRMSSLHRDASDGDQLLVVVHSMEDAKDALKGAASVTREVGDSDGGFSLSVALLESCSRNHDSLEANAGTLTLRQLGSSPGSRIEGELVVHLANARTGEAAAEELVAVFDFPVVTTTPHQPFSTVEEHRVP